MTDPTINPIPAVARYIAEATDALACAIAAAKAVEGPHDLQMRSLAWYLGELRRSLLSVMDEPGTARIFEESRP